MIDIEQIQVDIAEELVRKLTTDLPEYFGMPEVNEHYAIGVRLRTNLAAKKDGRYIGLLSLDFPYQSNSNIYFMAVFREFHDQKVGATLITAAEKLASQQNATTMTIETLAPNEADDNYLKTYKFYESCGFKPLFNLKPQGYERNMVYMVKRLNNHLQKLMELEKDARGFGFDWPNQEMILEQIISECEEIREVISNKEPTLRLSEEIGDLLHGVISLCRFSGLDVDTILAQINDKFANRMDILKQLTKEHRLSNLHGQSISFMLELWKQAKDRSKRAIKFK